MSEQRSRRVVITGLGVVAPNGIGTDAFWQATCNGVSGITHIEGAQPEQYPAIQVAGLVRGFVAEEYIERKLANRTDRMTHFAFAAIEEALADARLALSQEEPRRVGAVIANTMGGVDYVLKQLQALYNRGPRFMSAYTAIAWLHVANVGQAAIRYGFQGYCKTPINDTVGGLDALGLAYRAIRRGAADVIIAGGCEALLHPFILFVLARQGQYVTGDDPRAYRPFDRRAAGLMLAEGAGMCILEDYDHARQRGATIYGEIVGYGQTNDAHGLLTPSATNMNLPPLNEPAIPSVGSPSFRLFPSSPPNPGLPADSRGPASDGTQYARAIQLALREGSLQPEDIAYFNLDGRAIPTSDQSEAEALSRAFGLSLANLPVSVPRTMLGHSYAAAGALDAIIALLALKHGMIPPTINCEELDPRYELQLVRDQAQPLPLTQGRHKAQAALVGGRGTGGVNVVLALRGFVGSDSYSK